MGATLSAGFGNEAAGLDRKGTAGGKLGGGEVKNIRAALQAMKNWVMEMPSKAYGFLAEARKVVIQHGAKMAGTPFASREADPEEKPKARGPTHKPGGP